MSRKQEKWMVYAVQISAALQELFEKGSEHQIDLEELYEGDNLTEFMHALANVVPAQVCNKITGSDYGCLEFNHVANQLCFQFAKMEETKKA